MELFLHIGTEKTGSSFIQSLLATNRLQLERNGIHFPKGGKREQDMMKGRISPGNGEKLLNLLKTSSFKEIDILLKSLVGQARKKKCERLVLSNENLITELCDQEKFEKFSELVLSNGIKFGEILLVLRDPVPQAISLFKHRAKNGHFPEFEKWLENKYLLPHHLEQWMNTADIKNIKYSARKYYKSSKKLSNIVFQDWLCIGAPKNEIDQKVNPSLTFSELQILSQIGEHKRDLIRPLYEALLNIPVSDKSKNEKIEQLSTLRFNNVLKKYEKVWNKINQIMKPEEQLDLPISSRNHSNMERHVLEFSMIQTNQIIDFLVNYEKVYDSRYMLTKTLDKIIRKVRQKVLS